MTPEPGPTTGRTTGPTSGTVDRPTRREAAIALAGALAELGIHELELDGRALESRATDLPGAVAAAPSGALLRIASVGEAEIVDEAIVWRTSNRHLAEALVAISSVR